MNKQDRYTLRPEPTEGYEADGEMFVVYDRDTPTLKVPFFLHDKVADMLASLNELVDDEVTFSPYELEELVYGWNDICKTEWPHNNVLG